ncbi:MAG: EamA family transporter [Acidobacteriota bacterium]
MPWWGYALASAAAAAVTAVLAKLGVEPEPANVATALRTLVVLVFAWAIVFARGEHTVLPSISSRSWWFLMLSGVATGLSWLAYFKALQMAPASLVAPIDKLSLALTIGLAALVLGEPMSWPLVLGSSLIVAGALVTLL